MHVAVLTCYFLSSLVFLNLDFKSYSGYQLEEYFLIDLISNDCIFLNSQKSFYIHIYNPFLARLSFVKCI